MLIIWQRFSFLKTNKSRGVIIVSSLDYLILFIITLISILLSFILSKVYKNKGKVDKGFVFVYHKLTYRRKLIRTLWSVPFAILGLIVIKKFGEWPTYVFILFSSFCFVMIAADFFYNYYKWNKYKKNTVGDDSDG